MSNDSDPLTPAASRLTNCLGRACYCAAAFGILRPMSIRMAGGEWEPLLLGIEPRTCAVCGRGLYRNLTLLRGGWSRCSVCDQFVHYSCLASGANRFFKQRPRICKVCREKSDPSPAADQARSAAGSSKLAVGS